MRPMVHCFLGMLLLTGAETACIAGKTDKPPAIEIDQYTKTETLTGDGHTHNALFDPIKTTWWFSGTITRGVPMNPTLIFYVDMPEWAFFDSAFDSDGTKIEVHQIRRSLSILEGDITEVVAAELPVEYVKAHMLSGLNLKFVGSQGSYIVVVPPEPMRAFFTVYGKESGIDFSPSAPNK